MREDTKNMDNNDERDEEGTVKRKGKIINKRTNKQNESQEKTRKTQNRKNKIQHKLIIKTQINNNKININKHKK